MDDPRTVILLALLAEAWTMLADATADLDHAARLSRDPDRAICWSDQARVARALCERQRRRVEGNRS